MTDLIHEELHQVIQDWMAGHTLRAVPLGHSVRMNSEGIEEPHQFRQKKAYDYCFRLIEAGIEQADPGSYELFLMMCDELAPAELSTEERQAAQSLAWKALLRGWKRAIGGFPEAHYVELRREADA